MEPLARAAGKTVEEVAHAILERAAKKVIPTVENLIAEYELDRDQSVLVGEGGGAAALIPFVAETLGLDYKISPDAEVISSIGVALAMVREVVERVIPNVRTEDLLAIKREAFDAVLRLGAAPETVEVRVEVNPQTQRVRAIAVGASEMRTHDLSKALSVDEAREAAAKSMGIASDAVQPVAATERMWVFQGTVEEKKWRFFSSRRKPIRVMDLEGVIRIQASNGSAVQTTAQYALGDLKRFWEETAIYNGDSVIQPDVFVITSSHVVDLSGMSAADQAVSVAQSELLGLPPDATVALVGVPGARGLG